MNNDLIERIDAEIRVWNTDCDSLTLNRILMKQLSTLLSDCKAALTQQQEAEPVLYWHKTSSDPREWEVVDPDCRCEDCLPLYLHPPKPAAQPQVPEGYVVAPSTPNQEMIEAAKHNTKLLVSGGLDRLVLREAYKSMLKAAPFKGFSECAWSPASTNENLGDTWSGECGAVWSFFDAGPDENKMNFCPKCGGRVKISAAKEEGK